MEQTSNNATALINMGGGLSNVATSLTVDTEVNTPTTGTFRALIEAEIVWVTAVAAHVWTITRGQEGTSAVAHSDNTAIYVILTKEAADRFVSFQSATVETSNRRIVNFDAQGFDVADNSGNTCVDITGKRTSNWGETIVKPVYADYTFDGHSVTGTPTATQQGRSVYIYHPGTNGDSNVEFYKTSPATPYSMIAKIKSFSLAWGFVSIGIYMGDGTKFKRVVYQHNNNQITVDRYTAWNTFSITNVAVTCSVFSQPFEWMKVRDDGTNHKLYVSPDGQNWMELFSETRTTFTTGGTNRVGFTLNGNTGANNTGRVAGLIIESVSFTA